MSIYLRSIAIKNYRGIAGSYEEACGFGKFNVFCGPNNSGKSTVLDFIFKHLPRNQQNGSVDLSRSFIDTLDRHEHNDDPIWISLGIPKENAIEAVVSKNSKLQNSSELEYLQSLMENLCNENMFWIEKRIGLTDNWAAREQDYKLIARFLRNDYWNNLWSAMNPGKYGGDILSHWVPETIRRIIDSQNVTFPLVRMVPSMRRIGPKDQSFEDFNGVGLIEKLAQLQNPGIHELRNRDVFNKINEFLRVVTRSSKAEILIPHDRKHILVNLDERILPLSSLGTGIEQVVMISAFCTISKSEIVCLEEPEIHLHPLLQRRMMEYLNSSTDNQYFIATHSPTIIDFSPSSVYRVKQEYGKTKVSQATTRNDRFEICADLGHRASDIVQSNAVIWVEGPSDRIYLNHWISSYDSDLKESLHYSIMFYGGRLLSHLSATDEDVSDFISLRQLNRNLAVIIDSDKHYAAAKINPTKSRIREEIEREGGVVWITKGREIENYLNHEIVQNAVRATHTGYLSPADGGKFDHALHFYRAGKGGKAPEIEKNIDKVKVARNVCETPADLEVYDLKLQISKLVDMIRKANGMD